MRVRWSVAALRGLLYQGRAQAFYEKLGWHVDDGGIADSGGWGGVTIGHCLGSRDEVEYILTAAREAGATITSPGRGRVWGGYFGIFRDPDGHSWEIEHKPSWTIQDDGSTTLKA